LTVDPDLAETGQAYAFTGDDPLNSTDPLGLKCKKGHTCPKPKAKAKKSSCRAGYTCVTKKGQDPSYDSKADQRAALKQEQRSADGPCWPFTSCDTGPAFDVSASQLLKGVGVFAGGVALFTGVGDVIDGFAGASEESVFSGSDVLGQTSRASGAVATVADAPACAQGDEASCVGMFAGGGGVALSGASAIPAVGWTAPAFRIGGVVTGGVGTGFDIYGLWNG
jgi:hypothetical protein